MITRRAFLRGFAATIAGLYVPSRTMFLPPPCGWRPHTTIAETLDTDEGRAALAQSMAYPLRRVIDYQSIGRNLFMVDELPQYERDVESIAHIIAAQYKQKIQQC